MKPRRPSTGAQQRADSLLAADDLLNELYSLFDKKRIALGAPIGPGDFIRHAPSSQALWRSAGFDYVSIDLSGEHDSIALDLNRDAVRQIGPVVST